MRPNPSATDRRSVARRRKVGDGVACVVCGENRPELIHLHHPITADLDPKAVGPRCLNCHRVADYAREDAGLRARALPDTEPERAIAADRALAAELRLLADGLCERAAGVERLLFALDGAGIEWRDLLTGGQG